MFFQTTDALSNVCSGEFDRPVGGELEKTFQTFAGVVLINMYTSNGTSTSMKCKVG